MSSTQTGWRGGDSSGSASSVGKQSSKQKLGKKLGAAVKLLISFLGQEILLNFEAHTDFFSSFGPFFLFLKCGDKRSPRLAQLGGDFKGSLRWGIEVPSMIISAAEDQRRGALAPRDTASCC